MPVISFVLRAETRGAAARGRHVGWGVAAQAASGPPAVGMDGRTRGEGGELKLIQWQAPSMLSPHVSTGEKDYLAAQLVVEPLMHYLPDGTLIPNLITEVPTVENGLLGEDLKSVTYKVLDGVTWSDGEPLTADDVVFTWEWVDEPGECLGLRGRLRGDRVDGSRRRANGAGVLRRSECELVRAARRVGLGLRLSQACPRRRGRQGRPRCVPAQPGGTGPYKVETFTPNDQVIYVINENYREADKPFFERVNLKGGGDAASAARAVLQTGDYDFAWNVQVEPDVLAELEQGGKGVVRSSRDGHR